MDKEVVRLLRRRREHSAEFKRELVARSLQPGMSVAAIAMDNGINANLLFVWRRQHLLAQAEQTRANSPIPALLPVVIESAPPQMQAAAATPPSRPVSSAIEIEIGSARIRLRGAVDEASLRTVLTALRKLA